MPYKNREKQLAAQRAWNRKQTERRQAQHADRRGESRRTGEPHKLTREGSTPSPATTSTSTSPGVLPNSPTESIRTPGRRHLLDTYQRLRQSGLDDIAAHARLKEQRAAQRRQAQQGDHEREIERLAPQFEVMARRHLSQAGVYREEAVAEVARQMAERSLLLEQQPRQGDTQPLLPSPRLLALPPPQQALPIYQGVKRPATLARVVLGGEQRVLPEELRERVHEVVAGLARSGKL